MSKTVKTMSENSSPPIYPILVVIYFFFHLLAENLNRGLRFHLLAKPFFFALLISGLLWACFSRIFKSESKGAFFSFFLTFLFFSYGHFRNLLLTYVMPFYVPQKVWLAFFFLGALLILLLVFRIKSEQFRSWNRYFNITAEILLLFPLIQIAFFSAPHPMMETKIYEPIPVFTKRPSPLPDIYYLILDEYARADVLESELGYNNAPFLQALKKRGFFIAENSRSNYLRTDYSLSSSLNMRYLVSLDEDFPFLIKESRVSRALKRNLGYRYVFVNSGCIMSDSSPTADELISTVGGNDVELLLANTTLINAFTAFFFSESWRYRHHYNFKHLGEVPKEPGPKFVFAHILLPHPPFVFNRNGSRPSTETIRFTPQPFNVSGYRESYPEQLIYTNSLVLKLVDKIIAGSKFPPIIIVQSDHGIDPVKSEKPPLEAVRMRNANLTALSLPGDGAKAFNSSVMPVNIFRILFSYYFGADLPPLENKVFSLEDTAEAPVLKEVPGAV